MTVIEEIKEVLIEMQHETLSGVYPYCPVCAKGVGNKVAEVAVYWDKLMTLVKQHE